MFDPAVFSGYAPGQAFRIAARHDGLVPDAGHRVERNIQAVVGVAHAHAGLDVIRRKGKCSVSDPNVGIDAADAGQDEGPSVMTYVVEPGIEACGCHFAGDGRNDQLRAIDAKAHYTAYLETKQGADS